MTNIEHENKRFLDVVNDKDEVIDYKSRTNVHLLGLLHREVHVWMFDKNKNIIFQKRGLHRPSAGLLDASAGGHVNKGEDYLKTAVREVKEETGITIKPEDLILLKKFKRHSPSPNHHLLGTTNNFFRCVYIHKHPVEYKKLTKEVGIPGGGFQKLSRDFLLDPKNKSLKIFDKFILKDELPAILKFLK